MCWLSTSVPSQSNTTNFNDLAIKLHLIRVPVRAIAGAPRTFPLSVETLMISAGIVTTVSVAFSGSLH